MALGRCASQLSHCQIKTRTPCLEVISLSTQKGKILTGIHLRCSCRFIQSLALRAFLPAPSSSPCRDRARSSTYCTAAGNLWLRLVERQNLYSEQGSAHCGCSVRLLRRHSRIDHASSSSEEPERQGRVGVVFQVQLHIQG